MSDSLEDPVSDDEIFFGKLTLKEFKKHILWNKRSPVLHSTENHNLKETCNRSFNCNKLDSDSNQNDHNLNIIETHSEPDLRSHNRNNVVTHLNSVTETDDSFLQLEGMVNKLCDSSSKSETLELNNTLDVIDFILKNGPNKEIESDKKKVSEQQIKTEIRTNEDNVFIKLPQHNSPDKRAKDVSKKEFALVNNLTPSIKTTKVSTQNTTQSNGIHTPLYGEKSKEEFKTPAPKSQKKPFTPGSKYKSPGRINAFQHIGSPVSSYIRNQPQQTLVKVVYPKKPLSGCSSIPKLSKETVCKNKVNNLPLVAYKSAKKTTIINSPNQVKLPQSQWTKKLTSLPRPVIMKHERREINSSTSLQPEDSFAGLPYAQAEVSVCTKKSAYRLDK